jgi:hypothetical protein
MKLKTLILAVAGLLLAAGLGTAGLTSASAEPAAQPERAVAAAPAADPAVTASAYCKWGNLCVWWDVWNGPHCSWSGNFNDWNAYNCGNKVTSIHNNGAPAKYDAVALYWGPNHTGAWTCIPRGAKWNLRDETHVFNRVAGGNGAGFWQNINDNVRSHKWIDHC